MPTFRCIPLLLHPQGKIDFQSCEVIPGVKLKRIDKTLEKYLDMRSDKSPRGSNLDFVPYHVILIETIKVFLAIMNQMLQVQEVTTESFVTNFLFTLVYYSLAELSVTDVLSH